MNCHAGADTGHVPGLVVKSVVPGPTGGSLTAYRVEQTGHGIPFEQRFGGWHLTGKHGITQHWGNLTGRMTAGELVTFPNPPGGKFNFDRYPVETSDILPHLLLEHQAGFINRVVEAGYRARTALHLSNGNLSPEQSKELDEQAAIVVRYALFADEVRLPSGGVTGDAAFKADFRATRRQTRDGISLKDFDLRTHLFRYRCSYMIYSPVFSGMPAELKQRIYRKLNQALDMDSSPVEFAHLPSEEKQAIRSILKETLTDLPPDWEGDPGAGK
jgi:hypothetical protein